MRQIFLDDCDNLFIIIAIITICQLELEVGSTLMEY